MKRRANPYLPGEGNPYSVGEPRRDPSVQNPEDLQYGLPDDMGDGQVAQPSTKPRVQPNGAPAPGSSANQPYGTGSAVASTQVDLVCMACGRRGPVRLSTLARVGEGGKVLTCKCGSTDLDVDEGQQVKPKQARRKTAAYAPGWYITDREDSPSGSGQPHATLEEAREALSTLKALDPEFARIRHIDANGVMTTVDGRVVRRMGSRRQASYGIKQCPSCGGNNHENAGTCAHCGYQFPEPAWTARRRIAARVQVRPRNYRGVNGWTIVGEDSRGRRVDVFTEDEAQAHRIADGIRAGDLDIVSKEFGGSYRHDARRRTAALTCPKCGTDVSSAARVHGEGDGPQVLRAECPNCGWRGTKTKKASRRGSPHHAASQARPPAWTADSTEKWNFRVNQMGSRQGYAVWNGTFEEGPFAGQFCVVAPGQEEALLAQTVVDPSAGFVIAIPAWRIVSVEDASVTARRRRTASPGELIGPLGGDDGSYGRNDAADTCVVCGERIEPSESGGDWWVHATIGPRKDHEARPAGRRASRKPSRTLIRVKAAIKRTNPSLADVEVDRIARRTLAKVGGSGLNSDFGEVGWGKCNRCKHDESAHRRNGEGRACTKCECDGFELSAGKDASRRTAGKAWFLPVRMNDLGEISFREVADPADAKNRVQQRYKGIAGVEFEEPVQLDTFMVSRWEGLPLDKWDRIKGGVQNFGQRTSGNRLAIQGQYEYDWRLGVEDGRAGRPMDPHAAKSDAYKRGYEHGSGGKEGARWTAALDLPPLTPEQEAQNYIRDCFGTWGGRCAKDQKEDWIKAAKQWDIDPGLVRKEWQAMEGDWILDRGDQYVWSLPMSPPSRYAR